MAESTGTSSSSGTESDSSSSDSDIDDFRTGSRHGKRSKYVREVENKKTKFSRSKTRKTYRRKSGRKDRHASKGPFHFISTPPLWKRSIKIYPLRIKDQKCRHVPPIRNCLNFLFPSEKRQFFPKPPGNI